MNEEVDIILSRYFSGEATPKELHTLDMWLSSSDENEKYFHQMSQLYQYAGQTEESPAFNTEKALAQFKFYMSSHTSNRTPHTTHHTPHTFKFRRIAAVAALLAITTFALFYFLQPSKTIQLMATDTQKEFILFENAEVTLFPGTEIVYNKSSNHQVQLKGKATFTIQSEETKKLIVQAGETYIEDIGTIFTVDATAPDKSITVEVTEGEVWFYTENNTGIYLSANESAVYNSQTKQFIKIEKPSVLIEALPVHEIVFHDTPLIEAIEMIKARYNVDIIISSKALNEILLNASFDNSESVEYMLEIITATISAQLVKKNETYVIAL